jgi:hypothetical protein
MARGGGERGLGKPLAELAYPPAHSNSSVPALPIHRPSSVAVPLNYYQKDIKGPTLRTEFEPRGEFQKNSRRANDDIFIGECVIVKRFATVFDGADEAILRVREQDEEFCRLLRAAIERGYESCPIGVSTEPGTRKPMVARRMVPDSYY